MQIDHIAPEPIERPGRDKHIFYSDRVVDIDDDLPKYLQGVDGPLLP